MKMLIKFVLGLALGCIFAAKSVSCHNYTVEIFTGDRDYAATDADVFLQIYGASSSTKEFQLTGRNLFGRGKKDLFTVITTADLGALEKIRIRHDNSWWGAGWFLDKVIITDDVTKSKYEFLCYRWLSDRDDDNKIERTIQVRFKGTCGIRASSRIVNGNTSQPNSWPWQAQLRYSRYRHICGGALIHPQWVVTAAHCVEDDLNGGKYKIYMGEHRLSRRDGPEQIFTVQKIIMHKDYDTYELENDIALMKLDRPALLTKQVSLVCLPDQDQSVPIGKNCVVTGWGNLWGGGPTPDKLQEATLPTVSNSDCKKGNILIGEVTDGMLCGGAGGGNDVTSCHGDSGGPYVCPESGKWNLRGVVSWGEERCIVGKSYDVFTRVSRYTNWLISQISTN